MKSFLRYCQHCVHNQVRLALFVVAYHLGSFLRRLVLPRRIKHGSLRSLLTKLIEIEAKVVRHSRIVTFQMAKVAISKEIFAERLFRIDPFEMEYGSRQGFLIKWLERCLNESVFDEST